MRLMINENKNMYNQIDIICAVCGCKVKRNKSARHVKGVEGESCEEGVLARKWGGGAEGYG